jgi:hypothetical protein
MFVLLPVVLMEHILIRGVVSGVLTVKDIAKVMQVSRFCRTTALSRAVWQAALNVLQAVWPYCYIAPEIAAAYSAHGPKSAYRLAVQDTITTERLTTVEWFHIWSSAMDKKTGREVPAGTISESGAPLRDALSRVHRCFGYDMLVATATFTSDGTMHLHGHVDAVLFGECKWKFVTRLDQQGVPTPPGRAIQFTNDFNGENTPMAFPAMRVHRVARGWVLRSEHDTFTSFHPHVPGAGYCQRPTVLHQPLSQSWRQKPHLLSALDTWRPPVDMVWLKVEGSAFRIDVMNWETSRSKPRLRFGDVYDKRSAARENRNEESSDEDLDANDHPYLDWNRQFL